jgi:hypothetical protein
MTANDPKPPMSGIQWCEYLCLWLASVADRREKRQFKDVIALAD